MAELEEFFPGQFTFTADRDGYDYLYEIDRLADLGGKRLHAKRNHINRFMENNPSWTYEEITPESLGECLAMDKEWYRRSLAREGEAEERDLGDEGVALRQAMEHYQALGLEGGLIRVYGEVVAFTMGDLLNSDTYDVHFEKAYGELQGAYAMINREFARWVRGRHPNVRYLNREDDMGVEGAAQGKGILLPRPDGGKAHSDVEEGDLIRRIIGKEAGQMVDIRPSRPGRSRRRRRSGRRPSGTKTA